MIIIDTRVELYQQVILLEPPTGHKVRERSAMHGHNIIHLYSHLYTSSSAVAIQLFMPIVCSFFFIISIHIHIGMYVSVVHVCGNKTVDLLKTASDDLLLCVQVTFQSGGPPVQT